MPLRDKPFCRACFLRYRAAAVDTIRRRAFINRAMPRADDVATAVAADVPCRATAPFSAAARRRRRLSGAIFGFEPPPRPLHAAVHATRARAAVMLCWFRFRFFRHCRFLLCQREQFVSSLCHFMLLRLRAESVCHAPRASFSLCYCLFFALMFSRRQRLLRRFMPLFDAEPYASPNIAAI